MTHLDYTRRIKLYWLAYLNVTVCSCHIRTPLQLFPSRSRNLLSGDPETSPSVNSAPINAFNVWMPGEEVDKCRVFEWWEAVGGSVLWSQQQIVVAYIPGSLRVFFLFFKIWPHCNESVGMNNAPRLGCEIPEGIGRLPEEGAKVSNYTFHSPLRRKPEWPQPMCLSCKMSE